MIFAKCHITSKTHKKREIVISNILTNQNTRLSKRGGIFHFSYGIRFFQNIGTYSPIAFQKPNALNCSSITIITQTIAMAILKLISAVGILIKCSIDFQNIGLKKSKNTHNKFEIIITKNIVTIYNLIHFFSSFHKISSKKSYAFSKANSIINIIHDFG
jgi:hypothetical protein